MTEVIDVTVWTQTANHFGTGLHFNGMAVGADGDFAVITGADVGLLDLDERPPRTGWSGA